MKKLAAFTAFALSSPLLLAQNDKTSGLLTATSVQQPPERYQKAEKDFSNLPEKTRIAFVKKRNEAGIFFKNKRIFEALELIRELTGVFPDDPQVINLRGACFVELRDFKKAREQFMLSQEFLGQSFNVTFNLGEIAFLSGDWNESLRIFQKALTLSSEKAIQIRRIIEFKILLSHIALAKDESLNQAGRESHSTKVTEMVALYDYLDDSPYYYYANSALHYSQGDKVKGLEFLNKGRRVYSANIQFISSWEDTMAEYGYIKNFYGKSNTIPASE